MFRLSAILVLFAASALAQGDRDPVAYVIVNGAEIPEPLAAPGDAALGAEIAFDGARGGCFECHGASADGDEAPLAPPLDVLRAGLTPGRARLAVVNYAAIDPALPEHAWYDVGDIGEAPEDLVGRTRLTALEIEHLVAYLTDTPGE